MITLPGPLRALPVLLLTALLPASAATLPASFTSATSVPVTAASYTATGNTVNLSLAYAPTPGTNLTVVKNTGLDFIQGTFGNLTQGQAVNLTYAGVVYPFVANYYGGSGNDLVLQWANTRALAWGYGGYGTLGNATVTTSSQAVAVDTTGVLAGRTVLALSAGSDHCLALCTDGTLAAWGTNSSGQLGNGSTTNSKVPVAVDLTGVLAGKTIIGMAAGGGFSLVLCSDGTLAAWGSNGSGNLGNGTTASSSVAALVSRGGVLAGKTVIAVAAGSSHSLALCADGTVAAWGYNSTGQLGIGSTTSSNVPALVSTTGVLAGKTVNGIAGGSDFSLARCTDGTVVAWGGNSYGQLGNNSTTTSNVPVLVNTAGVLAGKTVVGLATGASHSVALCADGTLAAWGKNANGQLGNATTTSSPVPVLVDRSGGLAGKTVNAVATGSDHSLASCADGTMAAWGYNGYGRLGNANTTDSNVPVMVNTATLRAGERLAAAGGGCGALVSLAVGASVPPAIATTQAVISPTDSGTTLKGTVNANNSTNSVSFEYGLTTAYGSTLSATPSTLTGTTATTVSAIVGGLISSTTYHYRVVASGPGGTVTGADMTFTTTHFASLTDLTLSGAALVPAFSGTNTNYSATVSAATASITVTPVTDYATSTVRVNGLAVASGAVSGPLSLAVGNNVISVVVTAADGVNTKTYAVKVTRLPATFTFGSAATVPVTADELSVTGSSAAFALTFAPVPGSTLTAINNTGRNSIRGAFDNLAQGQRVEMTYGGIRYAFVANYYGGSGNDLVLQWANTRVLAWGANDVGQAGNGSEGKSTVPLPVMPSDALAGKSVLALAAGSSHTLALCADGTLAAWGSNANGQLGNGGTTNCLAPVAVDRTGVLAGKTVIAVAGGGRSLSGAVRGWVTGGLGPQ